MQKVIFDVNGIERDLQSKLKKSITAQTSTEFYTPQLKQFKMSKITDRPFVVIDNGSY